MPEASSRMKRPPISGFGEGTVAKRPRSNSQGKPKISDGSRSIAKAIVSGPDDGFRAKSGPSSANVQIPPRPQGLPSNRNEALSSFKPITLATMQTPGRSKPSFPARPPLPLSDDNPFVDRQKKTMSVGTRVESSIAPLSTRVRPSDMRETTSKLATPSRKVVPFHLLRVPVSIPDPTPPESSSAPVKKPSIPKFDLGGKDKGKMVTMMTMELPTVELPEEREVEGEALELRRGLLVSPEKGDRRRGRFIRNGLAERAQVLMNRSSTAHVLWRKEAESSSASHSRHVQADLRLRVKEVVHFSRNENTHSRSAGSPRSILAVCVLPDGEERNVLFSFAYDTHNSHVLESGVTLKEDAEILVWKSWQETKHPPTLFCSRFVVLSSSS